MSLKPPGVHPLSCLLLAAAWLAPSALSAAEELPLFRNCSGQVSTLVPYQPLQSYLQVVANRLFAARPGARVPTRVMLVAGDFQACAARQPSGAGIIMVHTELLQFARTEAELAGVMAHEVGHIELNHSKPSVKSTTTTALFSLLDSILATKLDSNSQLRGLASAGAKFGNYLAQAKYNRDQENEADRYGVNLAAAAGYNVIDSYNFFARRAQNEPRASSLEGLERDHPLTPTRLQNLRGLITQLPNSARQSYSVDPQLHTAAVRVTGELDQPLRNLIETAVSRMPADARRQLVPDEAQAGAPAQGVDAAFQSGRTQWRQPPPPSPPPRLGVNIRQVDDQELAGMGLRAGSARVLVLSVVPGSSAGQLGIAPGDLLFSINGNLLSRTGDVLGLVQEFSPGDEFEVKIIRYHEASRGEQARWYYHTLRGNWR
ncbi:M48 family metalloprotease [Paludibaculum fermentans]|uniref:M48 family metallopeptidase n=1 Tax=Paludibaculum fermentans TaxID=1473598 RepID=UPI003EB8D9A4